MVTILLATRITFLTLIENSVILDVLRITFLDEKSNSRCWYSPSKIDFYVVFSNFPKSFRVGWGWGRQCLTIAKQHVYTRMVHFSFCIEFQFVPFLYCQNGPKKQQSGNWQNGAKRSIQQQIPIFLGNFGSVHTGGMVPRRTSITTIFGFILKIPIFWHIILYFETTPSYSHNLS